MTADELLDLLQERPFKPLRFFRDDGRVREIYNPRLAMVSTTSVVIGTHHNPRAKIGKRLATFSLQQIARVEPIEV
ncbi:MAG TPA: hypothetical protein VGI40_04645 [Pirellulaceae bacterium]|jgi:hypothetical protein